MYWADGKYKAISVTAEVIITLCQMSDFRHIIGDSRFGNDTFVLLSNTTIVNKYSVSLCAVLHAEMTLLGSL